MYVDIDRGQKNKSSGTKIPECSVSHKDVKPNETH